MLLPLYVNAVSVAVWCCDAGAVCTALNELIAMQSYCGTRDLTLFMWLVCSEFSVHLARDLPAGARGDSPVLLRWVRQAR